MGLDLTTDDDLAPLADLHELEDLDLDRSTGGPGLATRQVIPPRILLTDRVLDHVAGLKRLKLLVLSGNRITDAGLKQLANLQALETLDLDGTAVTDAGLMSLVGLKGLKTVIVKNTRVTDKGVARFHKSRSNVEVIRVEAPIDPEMLTQ
jgi:hypothetical protein